MLFDMSGRKPDDDAVKGEVRRVLFALAFFLACLGFIASMVFIGLYH
jgi:hypothetical protein